jgi:hypothetical protein
MSPKEKRGWLILQVNEENEELPTEIRWTMPKYPRKMTRTKRTAMAKIICLIFSEEEPDSLLC